MIGLFNHSLNVIGQMNPRSTLMGKLNQRLYKTGQLNNGSTVIGQMRQVDDDWSSEIISSLGLVN